MLFRSREGARHPRGRTGAPAARGGRRAGRGAVHAGHGDGAPSARPQGRARDGHEADGAAGRGGAGLRPLRPRGHARRPREGRARGGARPHDDAGGLPRREGGRRRGAVAHALQPRRGESPVYMAKQPQLLWFL